jgi:serine/threonine-protein kinase
MDQTSGTLHPSGAAAPGNDGADLTGRTLGDFRVLRLLGQGGMGKVYVAEQVSLKRKVALKLLRADLAITPTTLQRFRAEAEAVARVNHPNIVQVYQYGECEGLQYIALEYVEGRNLRDYLAKKGPPEVLLALSIMRQVASALQRASELGIIHRDIKPDNILLTRKGEVKVTDFGLSRCLSADSPTLHLTQSGVTMGTPLYMSPEQVKGAPVDARTDIYSFGVTCYAMLAGHPPFHGENPFEVALHHVNTEPEPLHAIRPDLPPALCAVVHKMMAKDPAARYPGGRELIRDLARVRDGLAQARGAASVPSISLDSLPALPAVASSKASAAATAVAPPRRRWLPGTVGLSLALAVALGAGGGWLLRQRAPAVVATGSATAEGEAVPGDSFVSLHKREEFLKEAVAQYANPGKDQPQVRLGAGHYLELGLFYLDQSRLEEADQLFSQLAGPKQEVPMYRFLGHFGQAIVLGLRNRPAESNRLFLALFFDNTGERPQAIQFLKNNPRLHQWVARALDYNAANATPPGYLPQRLERFRHPDLKPGPRGGDKAGGKKT